MKILPILFLLITPLITTSSLYAVVYPFPKNESLYLQDGSAVKVGTKFYLFHSGTEEVTKTININDVLTVYQEYPTDFSVETREIGKVRVLSILGGYYFEGEVIGGYVQPGYVAKKGRVACYITSLKKRSHQ